MELDRFCENSDGVVAELDLSFFFGVGVGVELEWHMAGVAHLWREDENLLECQQCWICHKDQQRCQNGQCVKANSIGDYEWDCTDASDKHTWLGSITNQTLEIASFFVPSSCENHSRPFLCLSSLSIQQGFSCFRLTQIGDGNIDCAGGMDERNTLQHCSQSSSTLGYHLLCPSTNSCIPFYLHCSIDDYQCPHRASSLSKWMLV